MQKLSNVCTYGEVHAPVHKGTHILASRSNLCQILLDVSIGNKTPTVTLGESIWIFRTLHSVLKHYVDSLSSFNAAHFQYVKPLL